MEKILVIAAHPDDEVLGMGGTIAKYTSLGDEVSILIVTDGSTSQYRDKPELGAIIEAKKNETKNSAAILGVKDILYGELPDMKLDMTPHIEINRVIENAIAVIQPSIVYTHFNGDINKDHQRVYESTLVAPQALARAMPSEEALRFSRVCTRRALARIWPCRPRPSFAEGTR